MVTFVINQQQDIVGNITHLLWSLNMPNPLWHNDQWNYFRCGRLQLLGLKCLASRSSVTCFAIRDVSIFLRTPHLCRNLCSPQASAPQHAPALLCQLTQGLLQLAIWTLSQSWPCPQQIWLDTLQCFLKLSRTLLMWVDFWLRLLLL